jgi:hypothetical protein
MEMKQFSKFLNQSIPSGPIFDIIEGKCSEKILSVIVKKCKMGVANRKESRAERAIVREMKANEDATIMGLFIATMKVEASENDARIWRLQYGVSLSKNAPVA